MGRHEFAYALLPHAGGWREAGVVAEAIALQRAARAGRPRRPAPASFASVDDPNLVLDTIKRAEDSDAIVLRLYEAHGARGDARVRLGAPFSSARRANLLEDDGDALGGRRRHGAAAVPAARDPDGQALLSAEFR